MCSPIEERGMGALQDEQVMVGRTIEARSSVGRGARRDMLKVDDRYNSE
jgi:hypothetical protein